MQFQFLMMPYSLEIHIVILVVKNQSSIELEI